MLFFLIFFLFIGTIHLSLIKFSNILKIKQTALAYAAIAFLLSLILLINFDKSQTFFQFYQQIDLIPFYNLVFPVAIDGLSLFFVILSTFLIFLCILGSWDSVKFYIKEYFICFSILNLILVVVFVVTDLLLFYIFFECVLIPMFLIIGIWGSRERKIRASYLFFFYTLLCSLFLLLAIIYIYVVVGSTSYQALISYNFSFSEQCWLWAAFFLSLASKIPLFPFHIWLPEAHVEAPTAGSVLLAGILLKLGSYGFLRFAIPLFPDAALYFAPFVFTLSILGIIFTSLTAIRQTDFKRIVAYSSVAHMNLVVMGIFSFQLIGIEGSLIQSLSHGFVASALFFLIGILYDRYHTRLILYFSGLAHVMPLYILFFLLFTMANIALPGTSSFIGEFLLLAGIYKLNFASAILGTTGMILGGCYSLWLYNRISYGNLKTDFTLTFNDLTWRECNLLAPLAFLTLLVGIYPDFINNLVTNWIYFYSPLLFI